MSFSLQLPSAPEEWENIASTFESKWNFGNCIGALDGKHIAIVKPAHSGSMFYNYKGFFSIVLMALVNANYEFIMTDVGANGRVSDGGVLYYTKFGQKLRHSELNIPPPSAIANASNRFPYVFVGDDAFALDTHLLKPYGHCHLTNNQRIFNYRLSRARRVAENAFGMLVSRFEIFKRPINLSPHKALTITLASCYLHNYLIKEIGHVYCSEQIMGHDIRGNDVEGPYPDLRADCLVELQTTHNNNPSRDAKCIRDAFCSYFCNEGQIQCQDMLVQ